MSIFVTAPLLVLGYFLVKLKLALTISTPLTIPEATALMIVVLANFESISETFAVAT